MKYIILVGDGMGDYPIPELANRTPLEAAKTPAMDSLASQGKMYTLKTVPDGFPPGSDVANLSLLGYQPEEVYTGRSPLEAAAMGVDLASQDTAFRCNLVTLDNKTDGTVMMKDYSAGHISTEEAAQLIGTLASELNSDIGNFYPGVSYRHLFVRRGDFADLNTLPPHDYIDGDVTSFLREYEKAPDLSKLIGQAGKILYNHPVNQKRIAEGKNPANAIWLWGEGKAPSMATLQEGFGVSGALISAVDLLKGIGIYAGMEIVKVPGATGYIDTNYQGKAEAALAMLAKHDLVLVHVEAPDEAAHQGSLEHKLQAIEDFDRCIVAPIFEGALQYDFRLAVTCDHYTPLALRTHLAKPVPLVIYDSQDVQQKGDYSYSEASTERMGQLLQNGRQFVETLLAP